MKKSSKIITVISVFFVALTVLMTILTCKTHTVTGMMWFEEQGFYVGNVKDFSLSLDNITSLYINGNISETDYYNHLCVLKAEYNLMLLAYDNAKKQYPVKTGTHDYYTKLGCESVEQSMYIVSGLIDACMQNRSDKDKLIYTYLAYSQELSTEFSNYTLAYSVINYDDISMASVTDADKEEYNE